MHLREGARSFSGLAGNSMTNAVNLTGAGKPERIWGTAATANYFDVLGVKPILGRGFLPAEDKTPDGAPVVVISYGLWQTHFHGSDTILGQTISLNRHILHHRRRSASEFPGQPDGPAVRRVGAR